MRTYLRSALLVLVLATGIIACSSDPATTTASSSSNGTTSTTAGATATGKVSANTATTAEIAAALEGAGVNNADRWAREVVEYRPYPADDPTLQKLRDNLEKYNPADGVIDKIVSALTP